MRPAATVTEIYDYMRLLWARVSLPYSPAIGPLARIVCGEHEGIRAAARSGRL